MLLCKFGVFLVESYQALSYKYNRIISSAFVTQTNTVVANALQSVTSSHMNVTFTSTSLGESVRQNPS